MGKETVLWNKKISDCIFLERNVFFQHVFRLDIQVRYRIRVRRFADELAPSRHLALHEIAEINLMYDVVEIVDSFPLVVLSTEILSLVIVDRHRSAHQ